MTVTAISGRPQMKMTSEQVFGGRFDRFVRSTFVPAIYAHAIVILINCLLDQALTTAIIHLTMALIALYIIKASRDGVTTLIFTHVYWTFSFMTYFYAATHFQTASYGLGDPNRSALIALVSQFGLLVAFILSPRTSALRFEDEAVNAPRRDALRRLQWPLLVLGFAGLVLGSRGLVPEIYGSTLTGLLYVAIAIRASDEKINPIVDPMFVVAFLGFGVIAISSNARTALLALMLLVAFLAIARLERPFSFRNLVIGYFAWVGLSTFSSVMVSIRWARQFSNISMMEIFWDSFFSWDILIALINPFHTIAAERDIAGAATGATGFATDFFSDGLGGGLVSRLTILPQMDIVVSRIGDVVDFKWDELLRILLSALPSFGQQKSLIYSDEVVWGLGLRPDGEIGRPMITAEGELYAIGGYLAVILLIPVCFYLMNVLYRLICKRSGSRVVGILLVSQLFINSVFSTTILSVVASSTRGPLTMLLAIAGAVALGSLLSSTPSRPTRGQPLRSRRW